MEQVCNICGNENHDDEDYKEKNVVIICDNCLKEQDLPIFMDQIFS